MKKSRIIIYSLMAVAALAFSACKSTGGLEKTKDVGETSSVVKFGKRVVANSQTEKAITAKVRVGIKAEGKDLSVNGSLKMLRDDVIQLAVSAPLLGFEVGRMEFTKDKVLVIDCIHKQYVDVPYSEVDFLGKAQIDFNVLQAVFWNEIFVPGNAQTASALNQFTMASSGDHTLLSLKTAPKLDYGFLTKTATALLDRTTIEPKDLSQSGELTCKYDNFTKFQGKQFPTSIVLSFKTNGKEQILSLDLSNLKNNTDWNTRSQVSSKYTKMDARNLFKKLMVM